MLHVHRAERADGLVAGAAQPARARARRPVRARGRRGAHARDGALAVAADVRRARRVAGAGGWRVRERRRSPRRAGSSATRSPSPRAIEADADPWLPERAVWPLLEVVEESLAEPWLAALSHHLGGPGPDADPVRRARRLATLRHLAELFDRYALHRPAMVRGWAAGDATATAARDARSLAGGALAPPACADRPARTSPSASTPRAPRLREDAGACSTSRRGWASSASRGCPPGTSQVLRAIAAGRDVHLFLLHPSPGLWDRIERAGVPPVLRRARRTRPPTLPRSRLLASWGGDAREMQLVLGAGPSTPTSTTPWRTRPTRCWAASRPTSAPIASRRARRCPARRDERPLLDPGDRSVQVHACHGRARQVEVLRDAILHLLEDDPTLEPRDVIVMCPDIETFASLVQATFGAGRGHVAERRRGGCAARRRAPARPARAARRPRAAPDQPRARRRRPALDLAGERVTASQVLDLVDREPVRRRFGLDDDDLARIESWVADSGIRWGLDAAHRAPFHLDRLDAGTWSAGLDRVLVGVAMTEERQRLFAGRAAARRRRLQRHRARRALRRARGPPRRGARRARRRAATIDALDRGDRRRGRRADDDRPPATPGSAPSSTGSWATSRGEAGGATRPSSRCPRCARCWPSGCRAARRGRTSAPGHLTICTLMPMRSVPHRVVCLLGMDEGVFPRKSPRDGDDLMLRAPHVGDRDPRTRGPPAPARRAAVGHRPARRHLHRQRRAHERASARPRCRSTSCSTSSTAPSASTRRRPRATACSSATRCSRSTRATSCAAGSSLDGHGASTPVTLQGARALEGAREPAPAFLPGPLPPRPAALVELGDLVRFAERPGARVPAPAAGHQRRRLRRRGGRRAQRRARRPAGVGGRQPDRRRPAGRRADRRLRPGRGRPRRAAARAPRPAGHRARAARRRGDRRRRAQGARRTTCSPARWTCASCSPTGAGSAGRSPACAATCSGR